MGALVNVLGKSMNETTKPAPKVQSRMNRSVEELAHAEPNARELSARVSGTSEETAELFSSRETLIPYE